MSASVKSLANAIVARKNPTRILNVQKFSLFCKSSFIFQKAVKKYVNFVNKVRLPCDLFAAQKRWSGAFCAAANDIRAQERHAHFFQSIK